MRRRKVRVVGGSVLEGAERIPVPPRIHVDTAETQFQQGVIQARLERQLQRLDGLVDAPALGLETRKVYRIVHRIGIAGVSFRECTLRLFSVPGVQLYL